MENLWGQVSAEEVALVKEYFERSKRSSEDKKWLDAHREKIKEIMSRLNKNKADFGEYRVSIVTPDKSRFDLDKVYEFCEKHGLLDKVTKTVIDTEKLNEVIDKGEIDVDALIQYAWVEESGSPRIYVKKVKEEDDQDR